MAEFGAAGDFSCGDESKFAAGRRAAAGMVCSNVRRFMRAILTEKNCQGRPKARLNRGNPARYVETTVRGMELRRQESEPGGPGEDCSNDAASSAQIRMIHECVWL